MAITHKLEFWPPKSETSDDWVQCAPTQVINRTSHNRSLIMEYHKVTTFSPYDEMVEAREFEVSRMTGCKDLVETMRSYYEEMSCNL